SKHPAQVFGVDSLPTATLHVRVAGYLERSLGEDRLDPRAPWRAEQSRVDGYASIDERELLCVRREHLARIHPQRVDRRLHPRMRYVGAVAQSYHPVSGALDVITCLFADLRGDLRDPRLARAFERFEQQHVPCVEQKLTRNRLGIVAVGLLDQEEV